jgi:hypothetical protein
MTVVRYISVVAVFARFFGGSVGDPAEIARAASEAAVHLKRYSFSTCWEERRRHPGDDLNGRCQQIEVSLSEMLIFRIAVPRGRRRDDPGHSA